MREGSITLNEKLQKLSEREKETLRLLLDGHDAKSIARQMDLSVYTVNERLRDARRLLGVSSSREAARLLGESERSGRLSLGDNEIGVAVTGGDVGSQRSGGGRSLVFLAGGVLAMSLIITAVMIAPMLLSASADAPQSPDGTSPSISVADAASTSDALAWVALVDDQKWDESWQAAASIFKSQVTAQQWAAAAEQARSPLGALTKRTLKGVTKTTKLPGAPDGEYELLEFQSSFAQRKEAVETVILTRQGADWKVAGYFIR